MFAAEMVMFSSALLGGIMVARVTGPDASDRCPT